MKKFNKFGISMLSAIFLSTALTMPAYACTGVIVGSDLTEDGSTIFGRTEDLEVNHNKVYKINEASKYKEGETITDISYLEEGGYEFVFPHDSYRFSSVSDTTPEYGLFDEAGYNEKGLIADMTVSASANEDVLAVDPYLDGSDESIPVGITEAILPTVVLATADNALDAVKLIANEVATKGAAEGNGLVVSDNDELWYVEIYTGHEFVAMKYPKDKFSVFPNSFWLNEVNLTVGEESDNYIISEDGNFIYSKTIFETAKKANTFVGNEDERTIDLYASYAEKELSPSNRSRVASGILALNPDADVNFDSEVFEFLQDANEDSISVKNVMDFTRNRLENIDKEANDRGRADTYPIGNRNTMESHIFQVPENAEETNPGVMWLTLGSPLVQPYLAYYPNQEDAIDQVKNETNDPDKEKSHYWLAMDNLHKIEANREFMDEIKEKIEKQEEEFISATNILDEANPTEKNKEDAQKAFDLLSEMNADLEEKYKDFLQNNDYTSTFYGRRATANFTNTSMDVKKDTSDTYLNLAIIPDENPSDGEIQIVDAYGNPVEEIKKPVKISIPKEGFENPVNIVGLDQEIEVKEEDGYYTFETEKTAVNYSLENSNEDSNQSTDENLANPSTETTNNENEKSNKGLIAIGLVVVAALIAVFAKKGKKN